jgi:hypothetical protein
METISENGTPRCRLKLVQISRAPNPLSRLLDGNQYDELLRGAFREYSSSLQLIRSGQIDKVIISVTNAFKLAQQVTSS